MNQKRAKQIRKLTNIPDRVKAKELYKVMKKKYKALPRNQRHDFIKGLEMVVEKSRNILGRT